MICKICGAETAAIGSKKGRSRQQDFQFAGCGRCHYTFVANPWTDYAQIYNEDYYRGRGPDPLIDYVFELEHPERTVRIYEWTGILQVVQQLTNISAETRWLDFGCGNGGLVRYVRNTVGCRVEGFEEGWVADQARSHGIPIVTPGELDTRDGTCDVVTAIEVVEHVADPVATLARARRLLKPGGLLFLTTGNARPQRGKVLNWGYAIPEIHISFFEPETMSMVLKKAGFEPRLQGYLPGFDSIIRYKILKNLKVKEAGGWERLLPWSILSRLADRTHQVTAHPIGIAVASAP